MRENKLMASVSLFKELYDSDKDVYDILAEFLKTAIMLECKWSFNVTEATQLLDSVFEFKIPEAVIKTVLKNRLKRKNMLSFDKGIFTVNIGELKKNNRFSSEFDKTKSDHSQIIQKLTSYIEKKELREFSESEVNEVIDDFGLYLLNNVMNGKYSKYISSFIIENQNNDFTNKLNVVKEGLVLYAGIRYTADLNDLGSWDSDLTIFLDTEHLFNFAGFNGVVYKEIFNDFYKLVTEINQSSRNKSGRKKIELRYFEENKNEIENFFHVAELIVEGKQNLSPSKTAMQEILSGCKTKSDIVCKKSNFYSDLKVKGILCDDKSDYYKEEYFHYNIEDQKTVATLCEKVEEKNIGFYEDSYHDFLRLFTKINILRRGNSSVDFEKVKYILLTGKSNALSLANKPEVKVKERDVPFAIDIDFITNKFWFKLKKGFSDKSSLPKSFDIITKAQVVLSSQINSSITKEYNELIEKYENGEITKEQAIAINYDLREHASKPEDIVPERIENSLVFLSEDNIEKHLREKSLLIKRAQEGEVAIRELEKRKLQEWFDIREQKKMINRSYYVLLYLIYSLSIAVIVGIVLFFIYLYKDKNDTILSVASLIVGVLPAIIFWKKHEKILSCFKRLVRKSYRKDIDVLLREFRMKNNT